jgi:hypothetical protein
MNDTPKEIAELVRKRLLSFTGAERVLMGSRMFDAARAIMLASFPPDLSEIEIKKLLCERLYGQEVDVGGFVAHLYAIGSNIEKYDNDPETTTKPTC